MDRAEAIEIIRKNMPSDKSLPVYEALQTLVPELVESDDEKIREEMIRYFTEMKKGGSVALPYDDCIAYLERQKEQKPADEAEKFFDSIESYNQGFVAGQKKMKEDIEKGFGISEHSLDYLAGRYAGYAAARQEQKPAEWDKLQEDFRNINEAFEKGKKEVVDNPERYGLCKPAEWSEEDKRAIDRACVALRAYSNGDLPEYLPSELLDYADRLQSFRLQSKQEWSEDERKILDSIIDDYEKASKSFCGYDGKILVLKAIRDGEYNLPKQEWSEEDERALNNAIVALSMYANGEIPYLLPSQLLEDVERLKSLRPQQKKELTEEEKNKYVFDTLCALGYPIDANGNIIKYEEVFEMCKNAMVYWLQQNLQKMIARKMVDSEGIKTQTLLKESYLKAYREGIEDSIRELSSQYNKKSPQPLWKPTEEQIKAIRLARSFVVDDFSEKPTLSETLKELEEQLKKL